uniref:Uncharacterized protein n=1 Tax=Nothobranchius furzeri TaxID=105023 RepID=A0A8C6MBY7_NOTFU
MPHFIIHMGDEWLAGYPNMIQWLRQEVLIRYIKNKPDKGSIKLARKTWFIVCRCQDSKLLDALEDNDLVQLAMAGGTMSPDFLPCEPGVSNITLRHCPACDSPRATSIDFNSLSSDRVPLGRQLCKINWILEAKRKVELLCRKESSQVLENLPKLSLLTATSRRNRKMLCICSHQVWETN